MARPTKDEQPAIDARRARVVELRTMGMSYGAIARAIPGQFPDGTAGYDKRSVARDLAAGLADLAELMSGAEDDRRETLEWERLDRIERAVQQVLASASNTEDHRLALSATQQLLQISAERRALASLGTGAMRADPVEAARKKAAGVVDITRKRRVGLPAPRKQA